MMTALPIAFPNDLSVYGRENATTSGYEWRIGGSMLATRSTATNTPQGTSRDIYLPLGNWMDVDSGKIYPEGQTLKKFALPADKAPLFIGGLGVTLEQQQGKLYICIYPVATSATAILTLPISAIPIKISTNNVGIGAQPTSLTVKDRAGRLVSTVTLGRAVAFEPQAGETYIVTSK